MIQKSFRTFAALIALVLMVYLADAQTNNPATPDTSSTSTISTLSPIYQGSYTQRTNFGAPNMNGILWYSTTDSSFYFWSNGTWKNWIYSDSTIVSVPSSTSAGSFFQTTAAGGGPTWKQYLSVANGGTGDTTLTSHGVLIGEGTGAVGITAAPTAGQLIIGQTGANPAPETVSGMFTISNAGVATMSSLYKTTIVNGSTDRALSATYSFILDSSSAPHTLTLPSAATYPVGGILTINDYNGTAGASSNDSITVAPFAGDHINGATTHIKAITTNFGSYRLINIGNATGTYEWRVW